jgi:hypothetical protein
MLLSFSGNIFYILQFMLVALIVFQIPIVLEVVPPPTLNIALNGDSVVISWPPEATGYRLEAAGALPAVEWTEIPTGGANSVTVTITGEMQFFRLSR